jgi:hypothetical protein
VCADATLNGMSTSASDAERVARLAAELAELGRRLAWARYELLSLSVATPTAAPQPAPAPSPPVPSPPVPSPPVPSAAGAFGRRKPDRWPR